MDRHGAVKFRLKRFIDVLHAFVVPGTNTTSDVDYGDKIAPQGDQ